MENIIFLLLLFSCGGIVHMSSNYILHMSSNYILHMLHESYDGLYSLWDPTSLKYIQYICILFSVLKSCTLLTDDGLHDWNMWHILTKLIKLCCGWQQYICQYWYDMPQWDEFYTEAENIHYTHLLLNLGWTVHSICIIQICYSILGGLYILYSLHKSAIKFGVHCTCYVHYIHLLNLGWSVSIFFLYL